MILQEIVKKKREEVEFLKSLKSLEELKREVEKGLQDTRDFSAPLKEEGINIIAEIKKASPSRGIIREEFNPTEIARTYEQAGAKALSVLTEKDYFLGAPEYIGAVKKVVGLPVLRKDFIIDQYQLYESRLLGADCVLLIVRILSPEELKKFAGLAKELGMATLVEVHDRRELEVALATGRDIIGINNRDLETFHTDINTTLELVKYIPEETVVVSESGIQNNEDIMRLKASGVDAFLVGETLMREKDIEKKFRELAG